MAEKQQLRLDLEELYCSIAKRPRVVSFLASEIRVVDAKAELLLFDGLLLPQRQHRRLQSQRKRRLLMRVVSTEAVTLGSFSWDQDNDKIKIYISIEGADQEKVDAVFKPMSVDLKLNDINGKNYQFSIPKLNKEISPDKCMLVVKPTKVIVTFVKAYKGNWLDLHFKEDKLKSNLDKDKDPMAGIMDLMKNMDEEGDR